MNTKPKFIKGLALSRAFYRQAVKPILESDFPGLRHSAALIGHGSEVLGLDSARSTDHNWGPRLQLFLSKPDHAKYQARIKARLGEKLPRRFLGHPVNFGEPDKLGVQVAEDSTQGPVNHRVEICIPKRFFQDALGVEHYGKIGVTDWLSFPQQELLCLTAGEVFYDGLCEVEKIRRKLAYYPHDVWLYLLACQWTRIAQEEAFVGRCGEAGDELGSRVTAARLVRDLMRLCFLFEKRYTPYTKWLGSAFARLQCSKKLSPVLHKVLSATSWKQRETLLAQAYGMVAGMHNRLRLGKPLSAKVSHFHDRPYRVIHAGRFAEQARAAIRDKVVRNIRTLAGSVDQFVDSTDALSRPGIFKKLKVWDD